MLMLDFMFGKYEELCLALLDSGYTPLIPSSRIIMVFNVQNLW